MRIPRDFATNPAYQIPFLGSVAATGTGITSAAGSAGTLASLASTAGTVISTAAPVVLPIVAVAAAGYGTYRLIKWMKE